MPELSDETREFFAAKKQMERRAGLAGSTAILSPFLASWLGFAEAGPYAFAVFLVLAYAFIVDRSIDEAVKRARDY